MNIFGFFQISLTISVTVYNLRLILFLLCLSKGDLLLLWILLNPTLLKRMKTFTLTRFFLTGLWIGLWLIDDKVIKSICLLCYLWSLKLRPLFLQVFFLIEPLSLLLPRVVSSFCKCWLLIRLWVIRWLIWDHAFFILVFDILYDRHIRLIMEHFFKVLRTFTFKDLYILLILEEIRILWCFEYWFELLLLRCWWLVTRVNPTCVTIHTKVKWCIPCRRLSCSSFKSCSWNLFLFWLICELTLRCLYHNILIFLSHSANTSGWFGGFPLSPLMSIS
jgi:hypothetical protein